MKKEFGIALKEKEFVDGLTKAEIVDLYDMLDGNEVFPIELQARCQESSAMGFITTDAANAFDYDYEGSGLHDFIAVILDNIENENEECEYSFKGINIWLSR